MKKKIYLMRPTIDEKEINAIKNVFKSKFLTEGKITAKFESVISNYVKSKYAIATTSATTALHAVFECINIKNKKILVSDFTFPATVDAIILAGGIPILVDVDKKTMNLSKEIVDNVKIKNIKMVVPVSIFGNPLEKKFYNLKKDMLIVEDAATSLGSKIGTNYVGSLADASCFSFHPRKIITTGEGGMITTNNKKLNDKIRMFKSFGKENNEFNEIGTNYKMSDINSSIGIVQLKKIEKIIKNRQKMAKIYSEILEKMEYIELQEATKSSRHTYQTFVCVITKPNFRNKIILKLSQENIETQIGTYALHCLPAFKKCLKADNLINSEYLYNNSLSLPLHENLSIEEQQRVCKSIEKILKNT
jgi:perosamine synthetase